MQYPFVVPQGAEGDPYDEQADTMTDAATGVVFTDTGAGDFTSATGEEMLPGWRINVGFDNFARAFTEESIRDPLISVTVWTIVFAALPVVALFLYLQKYIVGGLTAGSEK